jgi:hypothetical protein
MDFRATVQSEAVDALLSTSKGSIDISMRLGKNLILELPILINTIVFLF